MKYFIYARKSTDDEASALMLAEVNR